VATSQDDWGPSQPYNPPPPQQPVQTEPLYNNQDTSDTKEVESIDASDTKTEDMEKMDTNTMFPLKTVEPEPVVPEPTAAVEEIVEPVITAPIAEEASMIEIPSPSSPTGMSWVHSNKPTSEPPAVSLSEGPAPAPPLPFKIPQNLDSTITPSPQDNKPTTTTAPNATNNAKPTAAPAPAQAAAAPLLNNNAPQWQPRNQQQQPMPPRQGRGQYAQPNPYFRPELQFDQFGRPMHPHPQYAIPQIPVPVQMVGIQQRMPMAAFGASPMMQNPMAPGLNTTLLYNQHIMQQQHFGYKLPVQQMQAPNPNQPQKSNKTETRNLLEYTDHYTNAAPNIIMTAYDQNAKFIAPTHLPTHLPQNMPVVQKERKQPSSESVWISPSRKDKWEALLSKTDLHKDRSPISIIVGFLTFDEIFNKLCMCSKRINTIKHELPLLQNLTAMSFNMFHLNPHSWDGKYKPHSNNEPIEKFFKNWSPTGLKNVKIETNCLEESRNFELLIQYLQRANRIEMLTIEGRHDQQPKLNEQCEGNLKKLLSSIYCDHLVIENFSFKLDSSFLNSLKKRIKELTVTSEDIEWSSFKLSQLPSNLVGLTICHPVESWISAADQLPAYLKRIRITPSTHKPNQQLQNVETRALFKKCEHVQLDFSMLEAFTKPDPEISTRVEQLDLFYNNPASEPNLQLIFGNLPWSLKHLTISYTGSARNALEGWWKRLSTHSLEALEVLELKNFDENGLVDTIKMFKAVEFPALKKFVFVAYTVRNVVGRLQAVTPEATELVVRSSEF